MKTDEDITQRDTIAAVIPCYKVRKHILALLQRIGPEFDLIILVDDQCPEHTADYVSEHVSDPRIHTIRHQTNKGVGGAVVTGYLKALELGADIAVKIDGDGQMAPELAEDFIAPLLHGRADYTKGNRFYSLKNIRKMPKMRIIGNAALSFMTKFSTGYWDLFDPTNGYTAIHRTALTRMDLEGLSERYFFETDILFRLNIIRARVIDIPMDAFYADETSGLKIRRIFFEFLGKHVLNTIKRLFYNYFLRDMSVASFELLLGIFLLFFGAGFSLAHWLDSASRHVATPVGTIVIGMISIITGLQLLLAFLAYDIASVPKISIHHELNRHRHPERQT